ncbi:MAG: DUF4838 domain-containing protein [Planctomycetes bacterium]|nr:DUF4838 domain-containing protein [Planctomycetota bacterium]
MKKKTTTLTLAEGGQTQYVITLAADAPVQDRNAAEDLAAHLTQITGTAFPIEKPKAGQKGRRIAVGAGAARAAGLPAKALAGLGDEGTLMRTLGGDLILTGSGAPIGSRGTLYAVYVFLEEVLGCRWWTVAASHIPKREKLEIPALNRRHVPVFEYRESLYRQSWETKWCVRNRTNGLWESSGGVPAEWGGHHAYEGFVHTFAGVLVPEAEFADHPEWFALFDGKRTAEQLCMSNPEVLEFVTRRVKENLRRNPAATITSVSQNDNHVYCRCPQCEAVNRSEGSPAGPLLRFVNRVAEAIEEEFPRVAVDTLAYLFSRKPPRTTRPRRNVIVRLCSFECDFLHSLDHVNNRAFLRDLRGWSRLCKRLYVWDYVTNYAHFVMPHPNWYALGDNVRIFREHNVRGLFEQANNSSLGGEMAEMRAWVLSKLLWNPGRDEQTLIAEFLEGYYGRAAMHIDAYMRSIYRAAVAVAYHPGSQAIQDCLKKRGYPLGKAGLYLDLNAQPDAPFLAADRVLEAMRHFAAALSAVHGDAALAARVELARMPVWYVALLRWDELRGHAEATGQQWLMAEDRMEAFHAFAAIYTANGITHLGEGWSHRDLPWLRTVCEGTGNAW